MSTHVQTVTRSPDAFVSQKLVATTGCPVVIWLLLGGNLVVRAAGFAYPFLAYHVTGRGHAVGAVGVVLATFGVGWLVGQLVCGWLIDHIGRRSTLVATGLLPGLALVLMAGAHKPDAWRAAAGGGYHRGGWFDRRRAVRAAGPRSGSSHRDSHEE